jgi:AcrR family transcriptional regulator
MSADLGPERSPAPARRRPGRPRTGTDRPIAAPGHPTAIRLLDAALRVADAAGLPGTSVDAVVAGAGLSKGAFYGHFRTRDDLLAALHDRWHATAMAAITTARTGRAPGRERLLAGLTGYLDLCRTHSGIRALLVDARSEPVMREAAGRSLAEAAALVRPDLVELGAPHPGATARLVVGATLEVALAELEAGRARADLRAALAWLVAEPRPGA